MILEGSGIHYPAGFDLNTVGEVRGFVSHFDRSGKGPVHFLLSTDRGPYKVLTCPSWYWDQNGFQLAPGAEVIVRGSKSIGNDGRLYLIAQELHIPSSGRFFVFRNKEGIPLWSGHFRSQEERPGWKGGFRERGNLGSGGGRGGHGRK